MDGVLVDTEPLHLRALNRVLAETGNVLTEKENERLLGTTFQATWDYLIDRFGLERNREHYMAAYDEVVLEVLAQPLTPADGAVGLLETLRARGVPRALASSSRRTWIEVTLTSLGMREYFPTVASGDDVKRGKPEPDIFLLAARLVELPAKRCLVIEDSPNGIASGRAAGMDVIAVRTPYTRHLPLEGATRIVESLAEIDPDEIVERSQ